MGLNEMAKPPVFMKHTARMGYVEYRRNDAFHRKNGPARQWPSGAEAWHQYGTFHRENGPAITDKNGNCLWFLDGKVYTFDEWLKKNEILSDEDKTLLKLKWG